MENVIDLVLADAGSTRIRHALVAQRNEIENVARIAADASRSPEVRLAALCGVVETVSVVGAPTPAAIADAVADPALIEAAIALGRAAPVIAALHQLARHPGFEAVRARTIKRFIDARVRGLPLAYLAIEVGDHDSAVTLAIIDFEEHLAERLTNPDDPIISAWLAFVVNAPEPVREGFLAAFGDRRDVILSYLRPEQRAKLGL